MPRKSNKQFRGGRGGWSSNADDKPYFGHDDRVRDGVLHRGCRTRVSFKSQGSQPRDASRNLNLACLDEDIPMATGSNYNNNNRQIIIRRRDRGTGRGRNSPLPHRGFRDVVPKLRQLTSGLPYWYKITIPYGHKYEKDYILTNLLSYISPETFVPIMYKVVGSEASFYIDDQKTAILLLNCDRKITTTDGFKLQIRIKPGFPQCEIDNKLKERLKQAMVKRYVPETNALDLSKFHQDSDLATDYCCALFRPHMLKAVLDIVFEHVPALEALNLDGNQLQVERLGILNKKFPKLKILYIGDNKIREMNQLDTIKDLKLEELRLVGNPVCNKYKNRQSDYIRNLHKVKEWIILPNGSCFLYFACPIVYHTVNNKANISVMTINLELPGFWLFFLDHSDVRKRFPKLLRLDGMELPKPILFDVVDADSKTPPSQRMFVANAKAQEIASRFLQQYILIFDSGNRQPLLDAYDEHACFSMTSYFPNNTNKQNGYLAENRNLYRINDTNKRQKLMKQGRLPVVSFISEIPQTKHFLETFTMDISLVTERMMLVTVTGLFKELDNKETPTRYFNRTFLIIPQGSGYCIRNEQLHITNATEQQLKTLNTLTSEAQMSESSTSISQPVSEPIKPTVPLPEDVKQQMTVTLSQQTNMNLEWSLKCLEEVQWNYDNAVSAFQELFKRGHIPAEAFNK